MRKCMYAHIQPTFNHDQSMQSISWILLHGNEQLLSGFVQWMTGCLRMHHTVFGSRVYTSQIHPHDQIRSLLAPKKEDGHSHNAKLEASKWYFTNQCDIMQAPSTICLSNLRCSCFCYCSLKPAWKCSSCNWDGGSAFSFFQFSLMWSSVNIND